MALLLLGLAITACLLVFTYRQLALHWDIVDIPNYRSCHSYPIPLGGGTVFACMWLLVCTGATLFADWPLHYLLLVLPGSLMIVLVSFLDDLYHVCALKRLMVHLLAAFITLMAMGGFPSLSLGFYDVTLGPFGTALAMLAIAWSTNLYNFMDGVDGIASMQAIFTFGIGGLLLWSVGADYLALMSLFLTAVMLGFIVWNWPPAKIFMGDVGSTFLGFLIVTFALIGEKEYALPSLLWLILYGVFVFDATVTLIRRILAGECWYKSHSSYFYHHRLLLLGWSHRQILLLVAAINSVLGSLTLYAFLYPNKLVFCVGIAFTLLVLLYVQLERRQPIFTSQ